MNSLPFIIFDSFLKELSIRERTVMPRGSHTPTPFSGRLLPSCTLDSPPERPSLGPHRSPACLNVPACYFCLGRMEMCACHLQKWALEGSPCPPTLNI